MEHQSTKQHFVALSNNGKSQCRVCKMNFSNVSNLRRHARNLHPKLLEEIAPLYYKRNENFTFNCNVCGKNFNYKCKMSASAHLKMHEAATARATALNKEVQIKEIAPLHCEQNANFTFNCNVCGKTFNYISHMAAHLKIHEAATALNKEVKKASKKCPLCAFVCSTTNDMMGHFAKHEVQINTEQLCFSSQKDFYLWKEEIEDQTNSRFIIQRVHLLNNYSYSRFLCNRSGFYKPVETQQRQRHLKTQGSNKINGYCPAGLKLKINYEDKLCNVEYTSTHVGHQQELKHVQLRSSERTVLAQKIAKKIPFNDILNDIREALFDSNIKRLHLVNRKDLCNIERSFNLGPTSIRHPSDAVSVDSWVNEMKQNEDCFIFYKPQGVLLEDQPSILQDDFVLIITTSAQLNLLKKHGSDVICLDGTHGLNTYNFELNTIMVLDELRQGFPCCFLISNRADKTMLSLYFSFVRSQVGILKPKVFMTDMAESFFNAWLEIMGIPERRLFCTWHVMHAWKKNLVKIKTKEKRGSISNQLHSLINERDCDEFHKMLEIFLLNQDTDVIEFITYFKEHYIRNYKSWAYCYRIRAGINTNAHLESMHKTIKYIYLKGKHVKRLDKTIGALMQYVRDKLFDRVIAQNKGKLCNKIRDIRARHKNMATLDPSLIVAVNDGWEIPSENTNEVYFIEKVIETEVETCDCQLRCSECNICIHKYRCNCTDSAVKYNICKHIHLLATFLKLNSTEIFDEECNADTSLGYSIAHNKENQITLAQISKPLHKSLDTEKEEIKNKFLRDLESVVSFPELEVVKRTVAPLTSTLAAIKENDTGLPLVPNKNPSNKNICVQRRFWSTKKIQRRNK